MLKQINFEVDFDDFFIISDTHFNHNRKFIYETRGFSSIEEHDKVLIEKWNQVVNKDSKVLFLGDFIFKDPSGNKAARYLDKLNGYIYALWGNHNSGLKTLYRERMEDFGTLLNDEIYPLIFNNKVEFLGDYIHGTFHNSQNEGQKVNFIACHFPLRIWHKMQKGTIHLSGHSHSNDKESNPDHPYNKRLDCSWENLGRPWTLNEIMKIMNKKKLVN